jgi:hypothetical protein
MVRVGVRFSGTGMLEVWSYGSTGFAPEALQAVNHLTESRGLFADGRGFHREDCWQDLGGVDARTGEECQVRFARVCGAGHGRRGAVNRGLLSLVGPLLCVADKVGDARGLLRLDKDARLDVINGPPLWIQPLPAAPCYERLLCRLREAYGRHGEIFPVSCPAVRLVPQRLLVLATGLQLLNDHQVSFWLPGPVLCRPLFNMSFHREGVDTDGLSTILSLFGQAVVALWANSTFEARHLGWCVSSAPASRIWYRLGAGFIWSSSKQAGQGEQYGPGVIEAGQMQFPLGTRSRARVVRWQGSKP